MSAGRGRPDEIGELVTESGYSSRVAYSFTSPLSLDQMWDALHATVAWEWRRRENYAYGDYLWASTNVPTSAVRIIEEAGRFFVDVEFHSETSTAHDDCESLLRRVREELLPAIAAEDIRPAEYHGR
jgi:hypothetical protein